MCGFSHCLCLASRIVEVGGGEGHTQNALMCESFTVRARILGANLGHTACMIGTTILVFHVVFVRVLQEAFPGWSSVLLWLLTIHSGQREIRERQHYSVDVVAAFYMGVLLWWSTGFLWSRPKLVKRDDAVQREVGKKAEQLMKASKDGDLEAIRNLLQDAHEEADHLVSNGSSRSTVKKGTNSPLLWIAGAIFILACVGISLLIFQMTVGG